MDLIGKNEGWNLWMGGNCPVALDLLVEVRYRSGMHGNPDRADKWGWMHVGDWSDVVAWRPVDIASIAAEHTRAAPAQPGPLYIIVRPGIREMTLDEARAEVARNKLEGAVIARVVARVRVETVIEEVA